MVKKSFILLTVPHAICKFPLREHNCDLIAPECAKMLSDALEKIRIDRAILLGNINRKKIDLNREESKETEFHRDLDQYLKYEEKYNLILFDIHSGNFENEFEKVGLLILKQVKFKHLELLNEIQNRCKAVIILGGKKNYIVEKGLKLKIPSLLFEFNENFSYDKSFFDDLAKAIELGMNKLS